MPLSQHVAGRLVRIVAAGWTALILTQSGSKRLLQRRQSVQWSVSRTLPATSQYDATARVPTLSSVGSLVLSMHGD